jgi:hypothetical protein
LLDSGFKTWRKLKMKQLFKTTLLAAAVTATCSTAVAGTVAVDKQVHSLEGLAGVTGTQTSGNITYTLGATYQEGDKLTLTFPENTLDKTNPIGGFPSVITIPAVDGTDATNSLAGLTWGLLNHSVGKVLDNGTVVDTVTYRVTNLALPKHTTTNANIDNGSTLGAVLGAGANTLSISYAPSALLTNDKIEVTVSSETAGGDELDSGGTRTATIAEAKTQFGSATVNSKFEGVINVSASRKSFVSGGADSFGYTVDNPMVTGWLNLATNLTLKANLYGEAGKMSGVKAANFTTGGTATFTEDQAKLAITYASTNNVVDVTETVTFTPPTGTDAIVLEPQDFNADLKYDYTSAGGTNGTKTVATGLDVGEWDLNGASVNIPYMPYSPTASQIIYVTNSGDQAGDISVVAFDDKGQTYTLNNIATANANTVTKLTTKVGQALENAGFTAGKLSLTITVNAPADDITVYASYNAGTVRGFVNTDQYKGIKDM